MIRVADNYALGDPMQPAVQPEPEQSNPPQQRQEQHRDNRNNKRREDFPDRRYGPQQVAAIQENSEASGSQRQRTGSQPWAGPKKQWVEKKPWGQKKNWQEPVKYTMEAAMDQPYRWHTPNPAHPSNHLTKDCYWTKYLMLKGAVKDVQAQGCSTVQPPPQDKLRQHQLPPPPPPRKECSTCVPRELAEHSLNVRKDAKPVRQPLRRFAEDRRKIIGEEVTKLLVAGFIVEVLHTEWLANPVLVEKKKEENLEAKAPKVWRMCIDYTNLNKACPKDPFPLPRIDQRPVYYLSEVLSLSKQNYPHFQKMTYGVFMAATKLKHYFEEHPMKVVSEAPISDIMCNKDASGRIAKWAIQISPYVPVEPGDCSGKLGDCSGKLGDCSGKLRDCSGKLGIAATMPEETMLVDNMEIDVTGVSGSRGTIVG
ncbi:hypothetical protein QYE76_069448 [Lolium multiflorum]|uniref:Reverse transcriptase RNase H-like domain-containing protein n=1 Tax=Lolium multiflorum TaxID=4521 RepID=A0AAD8SI05_LOLMU|nr:hypothetical protein QYE76_069448 [Lolium multiflorum]